MRVGSRARLSVQHKTCGYTLVAQKGGVPGDLMCFLPSFQQMWVFDEDVGLNCRDVTFVPGLYKIFDEILGKVTHLLSQ